MSGYYDDDDRDDRRDRRRDKDRRDRPKSRRRERPPAYEEEEIIEARRGPARDRDPRDPRSNALIPRARDSSESSVEEIDRGFPPGGGYGGRRNDYGPPRRARSHGGGKYDDYDDRSRRKKGGRRRDYSSESSDTSPDRRRPKPERRKSLGEQALAALGIGAGAGAVAGKHEKDRDRDRDRRGGGHRRRRDSYSSSSDSRSRSRGRGPGGLDQAQLIQAAKAALTAGAAEAFRSRKEPGGWAGPKGKRVLTAAIGAGGIDGLLQSGNKDGKAGGTAQTIQSVIGGLAGNRLINGKRDDSRSRSRSRGRRDDDKGGGGGGGGLAGLAAGGLAAAAGKALMDRGKSKDRDRRRYSSSPDDRGGRGKRSKSVTDYARQGMAALGIGADKGRSDRGSRRGYDDDYAPRPRGGGGEGGDGIRSEPGSQSSSEDDVSSSEEDRERKKMGHKQLITAGLASVATIHAGQSIYKSIEGRQQRAKEVAQGEMSPEEARKKKNKARMQDAAAIGIAALGIKGAYSEWKEMKEQRQEAHEFDIKRAERHARREQRAIDAAKYGHQEGYGDGHDQYRASAPNLSTTDSYPQSGPADGGTYSAAQSTYTDGVGYYGQPPAPHYVDGNPYHTGGVPPPPIGAQPQHYQ